MESVHQSHAGLVFSIHASIQVKGLPPFVPVLARLHQMGPQHLPDSSTKLPLTCQRCNDTKHTMIRWVNGLLASNHIQQLQFFSMEVKVVREFLSGLGQDIYSNNVGQTLLANQGCRLNHV